jgi:hypothetical protein
MKKLIYGSLFLASVGITIQLQGCKKKDLSITEVGYSNVSLKTSSTVSPQNLSNPYDHIGFNHNEMCIDFFNTFDIINGSVPSEKDILSYFDLPDTAKQIYYLCNGYSNLNPTDYKPHLKQEYSRNPQVFDAYFELRSIISDDGSTLIEKTTKIIDFEDSFLNNSHSSLQNIPIPLRERVKEAVLLASSVGRYSLFLWSSKEQGGLGYYDIFNNDFGASGPPDWVKEDVYATLINAWFTGNPFIALGGGVVSSVVFEVRRRW